MKTLTIIGFVLLFSSTAWASSLVPVKYCTSLLNAEEVGKICGRKNIEMADKTMAKEGVNVCALRFSASGKTGWDVPRIFIYEFKSFTNFSAAKSWLTFNKVSEAMNVPDVGDGAWLHREKENDSFGFQSGRHYFELRNHNKFCDVEKIKLIINTLIPRLPK